MLLLTSQAIFSQSYFNFRATPGAFEVCNDFKYNFLTEWLPSHGSPNSASNNRVRLKTKDASSFIMGEGVFLNLYSINGKGFEQGHSYRIVFFYQISPNQPFLTFRAYMANGINEYSVSDCLEEEAPNVFDKKEIYVSDDFLDVSYSNEVNQVNVEIETDKSYQQIWIYSDLTARFLDNGSNTLYITEVSIEDLGSNVPGCISNLTISQEVSSGSDIQEAENTITATNSINNGATAEYDAGASIVLKPSFHARLGSSFRAYIDGCTPSNSNGRIGTNTTTSTNFNNYIKKPVESPKNTKTISTYPNPTAGVVTINLANNNLNIGAIRVVDKLNQNVRFSILQKDKHKMTIRIIGAKEEIYFMKINTNKGVLTEKIVIKNN